MKRETASLLRVGALVAGIFVAAIGATWRIATLINNLHLELHKEIASLRDEYNQEILSNKLRVKLACQCMQLLSDSSPAPEVKVIKKLLEGEVTQIYKGTLIEFTPRTMNVGAFASIPQKKFEAFCGALEKGEWDFVSATELPISHNERLKFLDSKLSKNPWYGSVAPNVKAKLGDVVEVIPSTGPVIVYYTLEPTAAPAGTPGAWGDIWGW